MSPAIKRSGKTAYLFASDCCHSYKVYYIAAMYLIHYLMRARARASVSAIQSRLASLLVQGFACSPNARRRTDHAVINTLLNGMHYNGTVAITYVVRYTVCGSRLFFAN